MDLIFATIFIFSIVFTWFYGDVVDEYKEKLDKDKQ